MIALKHGPLDDRSSPTLRLSFLFFPSDPQQLTHVQHLINLCWDGRMDKAGYKAATRSSWMICTDALLCAAQDRHGPGAGAGHRGARFVQHRSEEVLSHC